MFTPKRAHARFCSPVHRVYWNREHVDEDLTTSGEVSTNGNAPKVESDPAADQSPPTDPRGARELLDKLWPLISSWDNEGEIGPVLADRVTRIAELVDAADWVPSPVIPAERQEYKPWTHWGDRGPIQAPSAAR